MGVILTTAGILLAVAFVVAFVDKDATSLRSFVKFLIKMGCCCFFVATMCMIIIVGGLGWFIYQMIILFYT
jgi:uncharacterized membrane protein